METLQTFWDDVFALDSTVWTVAILMSLGAGVLIHNYVENLLFSSIYTVLIFMAVMAASVGLAWSGVYFMASKEANGVATVGVALCAVAAVVVFWLRVSAAVGDWRQKNRYPNEPAV